MSDNPLAPNPERDARIAARADKLWTEAGKPPGPKDDFHERADELVRMEDAAGSAQLPIDAPVFVEEASIQANLGEFPGAAGGADQGEHAPMPLPNEPV